MVEFPVKRERDVFDVCHMYNGNFRYRDKKKIKKNKHNISLVMFI